jgi:hypothetical protein
MTTNQHHAHAFALLLVCSLAAEAGYAQGASVDGATKAQLKAATDYYERGVAAMDDNKFEEALTQFRYSYDTVGSPNSRMMVGRALVKLGRLPEAYRELARTLQQATDLAASQKKYKKTVATVQKELDEIKDKLAYVTVQQGAKLQLQGKSVAPSSWHEPQPVMPGTVLVEVTFPDGRQLNKQLELKAGERFEFTLEPPPARPATRQEDPLRQRARAAVANDGTTREVSQKTVGYVFGAVGLVGLGAFVGFGLVGASSYGNSKANCTPQGCPEGSIDNEGSKSMLRGIGYTGLGIGILGLGAGTWLVLSGGPKAPPSTALRVGPSGIELDHQF